MAAFADVSVVILAHNGGWFTRRCLASLGSSEPLPRQLVMVNNGSTDDSAEVLAEELPKLKALGIEVVTWRNDENKGCSEGRNEAWARATQPYVVLLDNDTAVCTRNWLELLVAEMEAEPKLGVLGPKLIYPFAPHPIQCAGVSLSPVGRVRFRGRGARRDDPDYVVGARVPVLISACWIMRNRFLQELGGLDPLFHPVQYEDLDYCMRVNEAGYFCAYTPRVEVYHFEGRTTAAGGKARYVRTIAENSIKFRKKWREELRELPEDPADFRWLEDEELGLTGELELAVCEAPAVGGK